MKKRLAQHFQIQPVILVNLDDALDQGLLGGKVKIVKEAFRIEFGLDLGASPINRNAPGAHRLNNLLRRVAAAGSVFKGDVKFVGIEKGELVIRQSTYGTADIVQGAAAGIHFFVPTQTMEEIDALARGLGMDISDHKSAEFIFPRQYLPLLPGRLDQMAPSKVQRVQRQPEMARILQIVPGQRVITHAKIRINWLAREVNAWAGMKAMMITVVAVENKIRADVNFHFEPLAEQVNKVVFVLAEFRPKIAKIDAKRFHGKRRVRQGEGDPGWLLTRTMANDPETILIDISRLQPPQPGRINPENSSHDARFFIAIF
jgi:hypothetical protein